MCVWLRASLSGSSEMKNVSTILITGLRALAVHDCVVKIAQLGVHSAQPIHTIDKALAFIILGVFASLPHEMVRCLSVTLDNLTLYRAEVSTGHILPSRSNLHF